jgi:hypothetical protein
MSMDIARGLLNKMADAERRFDAGDATACEALVSVDAQYIANLDKLSDSQKLELAAEAKKNHPILFEDTTGYCVKERGGPWRIEHEDQ